jgi:hypothetical protein
MYWQGVVCSTATATAICCLYETKCSVHAIHNAAAMTIGHYLVIQFETSYVPAMEVNKVARWLHDHS